ncbi:MAG: trypsin-like serine protease [Clostridium sp.]|nr:trypsin-like serine protease [Clostridium sp.]
MNKKKIFAALLTVSMIFSGAPVITSAVTTNEVMEASTKASDVYDMKVKDLTTGTETTVAKSSYTTGTSTLSGETTNSYIPSSVALRGKIIGNDDRSKITDTKKFPYSAICYIRISYANGRNYIGTAWMYSKNMAITAGHCVYSAADGGWPKSITVIPGANGNKAPFGSVQAKALHCPSGFTANGNSNYDFGIIELNSNIGEKTGYFGAEWIKSSSKGSDVTVTGYPGEKSKTLWTMTGPIDTVTTNRYLYKVDTTGGQSGCPVYRKSGSNYRAVSIHTTGSSTQNGSTRITKSIFDYINKFRK